MSQETELQHPETLPTNELNSEQDIPHPKRHNLEPFRDSSKTRVLRMWLNIIFMVAAVIGLLVYFYTDEKETAKWIMLTGCVFKFVELALRILKI